MIPSRVTIVASIALLASLIGFGPIFVGNDWLRTPLLVVVLVVGVGIATRFLDLHMGWTIVLQVVAVGIALTTLYVPDLAWAGFLPTPGAVGGLFDLLRAGTLEAQVKSIPITATPGTVLLLTSVIAPAAIATDILAAARRPVLAGLPLFVLYSALTTILRSPLPTINYVIPVAGFLALLWADEAHRKSTWGRSANGTRGFGDQLGVLIAAAAILIGLVVPAVIPTPNGGVFQLSTGGTGGTRSPNVTASQLTDLGGQLNLDNVIDLMTVRTSQAKPQYLRTTVLEEWDSNGWSADRARPGYPVADIPAPSASTPTTQVAATIKIDEFDDRFVPVYARPTSVSLGTAFYYDPDKSVVFSPSQRIKGQTYRVRADVPNPTQAELAAASFSGQLPAKDLQQPPGVSAAVTQLTASVVGSAQTPYEKTIAINNFFTDSQNGWKYSLTVPPGDTGDKLLDFLQNRTGFCEQYASAMASMLRIAGVPARVVIGYTGGSRQDNNTWKITTSDAHAWVEALIGEAGWTTFDPTPIGSRANPLAYAPRADDVRASASAAAASSASAASQSLALPGPKLDTTTVTDGTVVETGWSTRTWLILGGSVLLVLLLMALPYVVRTRRRRGRLRAAARDPGATAAHSAWAEIIDTAVDHHRPVGDAITPRRVVDGWRHDLLLTDVELDAALRLLVAEEEARFAPSYASAGSLAPSVRAVRAAIESRSSRRTRVLARLFPTTWRRSNQETSDRAL